MSTKYKIKTAVQVLVLFCMTFYGFFSTYSNIWCKLGISYGSEAIAVPFVLATVSVGVLFTSIWRN